MKLILTIILSFIFSNVVNSQIVDGIPLSEIQTEYISFSIRSTKVENKITINLSYGQTFMPKNITVKDENGKPYEFNSIIEVLNIMNENGYEYTDKYEDFDKTFFLLQKNTK